MEAMYFMEKYYIESFEEMNASEKGDKYRHALTWLSNVDETESKMAIIFNQKNNAEAFFVQWLGLSNDDFNNIWEKRAVRVGGQIVQIKTTRTIDEENFTKVILIWPVINSIKKFFDTNINKILVFPYMNNEKEYVEENSGVMISL